MFPSNFKITRPYVLCTARRYIAVTETADKTIREMYTQLYTDEAPERLFVALAVLNVIFKCYGWEAR